MASGTLKNYCSPQNLKKAICRGAIKCSSCFMKLVGIGDPVNVASRLESIAEPNQILIGEETYRHVKGKFHIKKVGPNRVKGKGAKIMVYEVID